MGSLSGLIESVSDDKWLRPSLESVCKFLKREFLFRNLEHSKHAAMQSKHQCQIKNGLQVYEACTLIFGSKL